MRVGIRGSQSGGAGRPSRGSKPADNKAWRRSPDRIKCWTPKNAEINEQISAPVAWSDISPLETSATDIIPTVPAVSAEPVVASIATIANAYGAYTGKSVELTWSFLEKLAAVRSLDKAFEVQTEFAKQVFETFLAESRKIHELHSELARQRVVHLEGFVARITQTTFVLRATYS